MNRELNGQRKEEIGDGVRFHLPKATAPGPKTRVVQTELQLSGSREARLQAEVDVEVGGISESLPSSMTGDRRLGQTHNLR